MSTILVVTEIQNGELKKASLEAVSQARKIANGAGADVKALVIGASVADKASVLGEYGADVVITAENASLEQYNPDVYKSIVVKAVQDASADTVLFSATAQTRDLAPRVAAALGVTVASDCVGINVNGNDIVVERSLYAGKVFTNAQVAGDVKVISLRSGMFEAVKDAKAGSVESMDVPAVESKITVKEVKKTGGDKLDVADADIIVTGGRGLRSAENFNLVEELASTLGGAVGATRAVVDAEWRPHDEQVGQTGKVVSPSLYFMIGASGSIQHWAGMSGSKCIVAINKDPEAPIVKRADYSIVGDLFEVLPAVTEEMKKLK